jgi:hypothetical protein
VWNHYDNHYFYQLKRYMEITENSANESELAVQYKTLAIDIFKTLSLPEELREGVGIGY